jgi:Tfp pilus assembly protein FimT
MNIRNISARGMLRSPRATTGGFTLFECLAYVAFMAIIISIGGMTFSKAWSQSTLIRRNADDTVRALHAGERWRADIRRACGPIRVVAGPDGEAVHIPTPGGEVVYRSVSDAILVQSGPGAPEVTLLKDVRSSRMTADRREKLTAWQWELELKKSRENAPVRPLFTFKAVPAKETP